MCSTWRGASLTTLWATPRCYCCWPTSTTHRGWCGSGSAAVTRLTAANQCWRSSSKGGSCNSTRLVNSQMCWLGLVQQPTACPFIEIYRDHQLARGKAMHPAKRRRLFQTRIIWWSTLRSNRHTTLVHLTDTRIPTPARVVRAQTAFNIVPTDQRQHLQTHVPLCTGHTHCD